MRFSGCFKKQKAGAEGSLKLACPVSVVIKKKIPMKKVSVYLQLKNKLTRLPVCQEFVVYPIDRIFGDLKNPMWAAQC